MDENHQDKTESKLIATEDDLWLPPLSPKDQKKLKQLRKKSFTERMGVAGKTPWDLVQLLIIPLTLLVIGSLFSYQQSQSSIQASEQQHQVDIQIAENQQQAAILQTYINNIQDLLLHDNLSGSKAGDEVVILARARTLTSLQGLDPERKGLLVQFIYEAQLIGFLDAGPLNKNIPHGPIIDLLNANLSGAKLSLVSLNAADLSGVTLLNADLSRANLSRAKLSNATLYGATLYGVTLFGADLSRANLSRANLGNANLKNANLFGADLSEANLLNANLLNANLLNANLLNADLSGADLSGATLSLATLSGVYLNGANLNGANLSGARNLTQQQLDQVFSCKNATLPPGLTCHRNR